MGASTVTRCWRRSSRIGSGAGLAWTVAAAPGVAATAGPAGAGAPGEGSRRSRTRSPLRSTSISARPNSRSSSSRARISFRVIPRPSLRLGAAQLQDLAGALDVRACPGIDLEHVALVDEEGDRDDGAGLERGRLGATGRGVPPHAGIRPDDPELGERRQLDRRRLAV